jgi:hypothetical protein
MKKMKSNKIFVSLILVLGMASCDKQIALNLPDYKQKIVINGELSTEDNIKVQVSQSLSSLNSDSTYFLQNASVKLLEDGNPVGTLTYSQQYYTFPFKPKQGKTYRIEASNGGLPAAFSQTVIPGQIGCESKYTPNVGLDKDGFPYGQLSVKITDNGAVKNYFQFSIRYYDSSIQRWSSYIINSEDPIFINNRKKDDGSYLFSDASFSGQAKLLKFDIPTGLTQSNITFEVTIKTFIEEYYRYLEQISDFKANGFATSDPVIIRSNVSNGLGMVGGIYNIRDTVYSK